VKLKAAMISENKKTWRIKEKLKRLFVGDEQLEGRGFKIEFHWVPIDKIKDIDFYPNNTVKLLEKSNEGVQHFVYREE